MTLLNEMPHTVAHYRKKYSRDEYIGNVTQLELRTSGVSAWVQNASDREVQEFQKQDELVTHKVYYATNPDLRPGDVVRVTAGPSFVGKDLNYASSTERSAGVGVLYRVMCSEDNNEQEAFTA